MNASKMLAQHLDMNVLFTSVMNKAKELMEVSPITLTLALTLTLTLTTDPNPNPNPSPNPNLPLTLTLRRSTAPPSS